MLLIKKLQFIACLLAMFAAFVGCKKEDDEPIEPVEETPQNYTVTGKAQKGPFVAGTVVTLNELNESMGQTGNSFTTSINSDLGDFGWNDIELESNLGLLTASGYYFRELIGSTSSGPLSLQALTDMSANQTVNINVMTHLIRGRIENLVSNGMVYSEAKAQAQTEFLTFMGVPEPFNVDFDDMDISENEDYNAALLAISVMVQRWPELSGATAELTQRLANLSSDFADDGLIEQILTDTLMFNIAQLNLMDIRSNLEDRYAQQGVSVTVPDFESYIGYFQEQHAETLHNEFTYPDMAPIGPYFSQSNNENLLVKTETDFELDLYAFAAISPLNSTLEIKVTTLDGSFSWLNNTGWYFDSNGGPNEVTLIGQRQNQVMSIGIGLQPPSGSILVEYFEDSDTPTFTKTVEWGE